MKKTYIAPEVEITRFNTEDIMTSSQVYTEADVTANGAVSAGVVDMDYEQIFGA